jgi:hypothetical protein
LRVIEERRRGKIRFKINRLLCRRQARASLLPAPRRGRYVPPRGIDETRKPGQPRGARRANERCRFSTAGVKQIPTPCFGFDFPLAIERAPHPRMPLKARPLLFRCNSPSPAEICDLHPLTSSFLLLNFTRRPPSACLQISTFRLSNFYFGFPSSFRLCPPPPYFTFLLSNFYFQTRHHFQSR